MRIERIDSSHLDSLACFLGRCGRSLETFRYFSKRPLSVVENHLATLLGFDDRGDPVAYGHLDPEDGTVWLGICVAEPDQGRGFGRQMMQALLNEALAMELPSIDLSVDRGNLQAIKLYEHYGFKRLPSSGLVVRYKWEGLAPSRS